MSEKKKVLILTASPVRDRYIDKLIARELTTLGSEVRIHPCLREGRDATLEFLPDVVVVPPIRNIYARDLAEQLKKWKCGVITRHTEPSCSWQDWKRMNEKQKMEILGRWPYMVDMELVWSQDEAEILNKRQHVPFRAMPVGSFSADVYKNKDYVRELKKKSAFNAKWKFNSKKKTLLIASPWGFADTAPDLHIDDIANP
ncbi:MAG: hypothetical protein ACYSW7_11055 [Planctomycetota bacterium]|jgi:hypothetical protein